MHPLLSAHEKKKKAAISRKHNKNKRVWPPSVSQRDAFADTVGKKKKKEPERGKKRKFLGFCGPLKAKQKCTAHSG